MKTSSFFIAVITVLLSSNLFSDFVGQFLKKGYISNHEGEKCWYHQSVNKEGRYFHDDLTAITGAMTFDNRQCMSGEGFERDVNIMMINNIISRWYGRGDANFETKVNELNKGSLFQIKGKCMQSLAYPTVGIAVDYKIEGRSITQVLHSSTVQGCTN